MNGYSRKSPSKRRYEGSKYPALPKKKPRTGKERVPQPKNTVAMLNELRHGLVYKLESQTGPVHAPLFTISVEVDGQKYMGQGRSKKIARIEAAATALRSFIQFKDGAVLTPLKPTCNLDFTSDEHLENGIANYDKLSTDELVSLLDALFRHAKFVKKLTPFMKVSDCTLSMTNVNKSAITVDGQKKVPDKGPVMLLYELFNDVHFDCSTVDGAQNNCRFKMTVTVNNSKFDGTGPSKKLAKNAAAKAALASLCNISYSPMMHPQKNVPLPIDDKTSSMELPQIHADTIGRLVLEKFMEVIKGQESYSRRKVLAGIVMTEDMNFSEAKVISVSTGTKCVSGEHMSVTGAVLNDSHAEIVSRRCLMKYLYAQLDLQCSQATANQSIFVRNQDNGQYPYKLKSGVHFHLYINTAPCGDARIFSPHENDTGVDKHPNRKARGQLRTKIESGEGTIPVKSKEGLQTWDGVLQGERLLTMSCSDKIARWNIVGIQGSLLASIVEPIYLHSIVLGSLLHPEHMYRAVCGRIEKSIQGLPPPYHLNKPRLALVTSAEPRNQAKAPNFGINWTIGDSEVEVVNSLTGKTVNNQISRITKQMYFMKYGYLMKNLPGIPNRKLTTDYGQTKERVKDYQIAKKELFAAFRREDLGSWLKKPMEQDQFALPE
ncbi:PREDICTED: double-stranded RNA-specific editase Adar isoform X1 [Rhagoletis zephyria]|nr:PREDICTED: double-stranded RNA-specific editase Adar isoform X1 [Rhagoletis zephyria]XP_017480712.1 PREDICTED: double-stranded RNA-specific editase Adar isoform X2 [Rhagoletis zephyria]XP_017480713.1 PREDICTED: double-stranded RNA-specific editase Adar isoform X1 [Rhagoletis zephyria]